MPPTVAVWSSAPTRSFLIDLEQTLPFDLGDYPRDNPVWGNLRIHYGPHSVAPYLILGYDPFVLLSDNQIKWDNGLVEPLDRIKAPLKSFRRHVTISWQEVQDYAQHFDKILPSDWE